VLPKEEISQFIYGFLIIGFILGAILLMLGFRRAGHFLFLLLIFAITFPLLWELLPPWVTAIFVAFLALVFLQVVVSFILGKAAADTMVGNLAADLVRWLVMILILPVQIVRRVFRMIGRDQ
jgi:xanthine/uracil permease